MSSIQKEVKRSWWYHTLRTCSYYAFRHWALWLFLFVSLLGVWYWYCFAGCPKSSECCTLIQYRMRIAEAQKQLTNCCDCHIAINEDRSKEIANEIEGPKDSLPKEIEGQPAPCEEGMDVVFLIDYTGSMSSMIEKVKTSVNTIVSTIVGESNENYRLALVLYDEERRLAPLRYANAPTYKRLPTRDKIVQNNKNSTASIFALERLEALNNFTNFKKQLNLLNTSSSLPLGTGNEFPEPAGVALEEIVINRRFGAFRPGVSKFIVLITDANDGGKDEVYDPKDPFVSTFIKEARSENVQMLLMTRYNRSTLDEIAEGTGGLVSRSTELNPIDVIKVIQDVCDTNTKSHP